MAFPPDPVERLRVIGNAETGSYLLLVLVAMPAKRMLGWNAFHFFVGSVHGVLFLTFGLAMLLAWRDRKWPFRVPFLGMLSAMVPFGPHYFHRWVKKGETDAVAD